MATTRPRSKKLADQALAPAHALWRLDRPGESPYRFQAKSAAEAVHRQDRTRKALHRLLTPPRLRPAPVALRRLKSVDRGDFVREKLLLRTSRKNLMPVHLLLPKRAPRPLPVVTAFHGHGYGVKDIIGLRKDGTDRKTRDGYHQDFAAALCRRGIAVAAPEISCLGERQAQFHDLETIGGAVAPTTCTHSAIRAFHLGGSVVELRVYDAWRLVDYLRTRRDLDTGRVGTLGISGGGMHALFSACLDTRIRVAVISGYFWHWRRSLLAIAHCACNFVPGLHQFGEVDGLTGLISPRPLFVEAGTRDPIFPIAGGKQAVQDARRIHAAWGVPENLQTEFFEGRHQIHGGRSYSFLMHHLAPKVPRKENRK